jgi:hypothetical protein
MSCAISKFPPWWVEQGCAKIRPDASTTFRDNRKEPQNFEFLFNIKGSPFSFSKFFNIKRSPLLLKKFFFARQRPKKALLLRSRAQTGPGISVPAIWGYICYICYIHDYKTQLCMTHSFRIVRFFYDAIICFRGRGIQKSTSFWPLTSKSRS